MRSLQHVGKALSSAYLVPVAGRQNQIPSNFTAGPSNRFASPGPHRKLAAKSNGLAPRVPLTAICCCRFCRGSCTAAVQDQGMLCLGHAANSQTAAEPHTSVSLEPLKGTCLPPLSSARMHSFSASRLLLISAPSRRVCRSLSYVSAER